MVIRQPVNGAIFQTYDEVAPRRKMSRGMSIAIGASVVAHVAVGIYLYNANFNTPVPQQAEAKDPPMIWFTPDHPKPPPTEKVQPSKPAQPPVHTPVLTPLTPLSNTLPFDPPPLKPDATIDNTRTAANPGPTIIDTPKPRKITRPEWLAKPDAEAMAKEYPDRAIRMGVTGSATINCTVAVNGTINSCDVVSETPANYGFGDAAKKLARYFKMRPQMEDGQPVAGGTIQIPIQFRLSGGG
jgi:protein TonB